MPNPDPKAKKVEGNILVGALMPVLAGSEVRPQMSMLTGLPEITEEESGAEYLDEWSPTKD